MEHIVLNYKDIFFLSYSNKMCCETLSAPFLNQHSVIYECDALVQAILLLKVICSLDVPSDSKLTLERCLGATSGLRNTLGGKCALARADA